MHICAYATQLSKTRFCDTHERSFRPVLLNLFCSILLQLLVSCVQGGDATVLVCIKLCSGMLNQLLVSLPLSPFRCCSLTEFLKASDTDWKALNLSNICSAQRSCSDLHLAVKRLPCLPLLQNTALLTLDSFIDGLLSIQC